MLAKIFKSFSGTKNSKVPEFYTTDLHSHLIPSIDDGSESMTQSLEMIQELSDLGFKKLITTPHTMSHRFPNSKQDILDGFSKLKDAVINQGIQIELEVASEYYFDEHFFELIEEGDLLSFGDNYILFELSYTALPFGVENVVYKLLQKGYKPILAHPERYATFQSDHKKYEALKDTGLLFQLNVNSLDGFYGKATKRAAEFLVENGMIDFVGSDTHRPKYVEALKKTMSNKKTSANNTKQPYQKLSIVIKTFFVLFLFSVALQALDLNETDKQKHFTLSAIIAMGTNQYLYHNTSLTQNKRIGYSIVLSNIPGVIKELKDDREKNNKFDKEDIKANLIGSVLGVVLSESFSYIYFDISKNRHNLKFNYRF